MNNNQNKYKQTLTAQLCNGTKRTNRFKTERNSHHLDLFKTFQQIISTHREQRPGLLNKASDKHLKASRI